MSCLWCPAGLRDITPYLMSCLWCQIGPLYLMFVYEPYHVPPYLIFCPWCLTGPRHCHTMPDVCLQYLTGPGPLRSFHLTWCLSVLTWQTHHYTMQWQVAWLACSMLLVVAVSRTLWCVTTRRAVPPLVPSCRPSWACRPLMWAHHSSACIPSARWATPQVLCTVPTSSGYVLTSADLFRLKIQGYFIITSEKLKCGWTSTSSQYTITLIVYFKTQRTVIENTKVT